MNEVDVSIALMVISVIFIISAVIHHNFSAILGWLVVIILSISIVERHQY